MPLHPPLFKPKSHLVKSKPSQMLISFNDNGRIRLLELEYFTPHF